MPKLFQSFHQNKGENPLFSQGKLIKKNGLNHSLLIICKYLDLHC